MNNENRVLSNFKYPYPRQKVFGLFLIGIAVTITLSIILGNNKYPNPLVFVIGYAGSMLGIMFNKKVRQRFSIGEATELQKKASNIGLIVIAVAAPVIGISLSGTGNYRLIWLLIFLAVGIHFIPFVVVHGRLTLLLAILTIINACVGIYFADASFAVFGFIDACIKLIIGILMLMLSPRRVN